MYNRWKLQYFFVFLHFFFFFFKWSIYQQPFSIRDVNKCEQEEKEKNKEQNKAKGGGKNVKWEKRREQKDWERKQINGSISAAECLSMRVAEVRGMFCSCECYVSGRRCSVHGWLRLHCETTSKLIIWRGGNFRFLWEKKVCQDELNTIMQQQRC